MRERNIYLWVGGAMLVLYLLVALLGRWLAPYGGNDQDLLNVLAAPSKEHLLGTDQVGRDLLSRLILGTRFTLTVPGSGYAEVDVRAEGTDHYVFSRPVVITIDYSDCGVAPTAKPFYGWYIDQSSHSLLENMAGVDDRYNQRLFFATMHLSGYAVAYVRDEVE